MRVYVIPTNRPCVRRDEPDAIFMSRAEKYKAIIAEVKSCYEKGQPVLVGTLSVSISESLSKMLDRENIPHQVLNAKEDAHEEYEHKKIYPPKAQVFSAFETVDYPDVKVVILGQDPYHQPGQAHGMMRISVVLPAASGPTRPVIRPAGMRALTPSRAVTVSRPLPKRMPRPSSR